jgi:hypothetical protein
MTPSHDPLTLICGVVYILLALYVAGLWAFCLFRTGMVFCYFYIVAAVVGAFISVVSVAMHLDPYVWVRLLGKAGWRISYYVIIVVQPIGVLIGATGATILVRWLTKRSNQSLESIPGSRDAQL